MLCKPAEELGSPCCCWVGLVVLADRRAIPWRLIGWPWLTQVGLGLLCSSCHSGGVFSSLM